MLSGECGRYGLLAPPELSTSECIGSASATDRTMPHSDAGRGHLLVSRIIAPNNSEEVGEEETVPMAQCAMQSSHDIGGSAMGVGIGQVRLDSKVG